MVLKMISIGKICDIFSLFFNYVFEQFKMLSQFSGFSLMWIPTILNVYSIVVYNL